MIDIKDQQLKIIETLMPDSEIVFLADCGSRAWNFNSDVSDYDLKGVSIKKNRDYYRELFEEKDVKRLTIEELNCDATIYDVKKFFNFVWKGNAQAYEILASDIQYTEDKYSIIRSQLLEFMKNEKLRDIAYHYYGIAKSCNEKHSYGDDNDLEPKQLLYIIKPILHVLEISQDQELPDLNFETSLDYMRRSIPSDNMLLFIYKLHNMKRNNDTSTDYMGTESYLELTKWFDKIIPELRLLIDERLPKSVIDKESKTKFNKIYLDFIDRF